MLPFHHCVGCFLHRLIDFASLLDRMRIILPGFKAAVKTNPEIIDEDGVSRDLFAPEARRCCKKVARLLSKEKPLRDQWEWASQVVELLSPMPSSTGMQVVALWAIGWRRDCRHKIDEIDACLACLGNRLGEFRVNE